MSEVTPATDPLDEWSNPFRLTVEYEIQVTERMKGWLDEMRAEGCSEREIAEEIGSFIHTDHKNTNIVDADAELWDGLESIFGEGGDD